MRETPGTSGRLGMSAVPSEGERWQPSIHSYLQWPLHQSGHADTSRRSLDNHSRHSILLSFYQSVDKATLCPTQTCLTSQTSQKSPSLTKPSWKRQRQKRRTLCPPKKLLSRRGKETPPHDLWEQMTSTKDDDRHYNSYFCFKGAIAPCDAWLPWWLESLGLLIGRVIDGEDMWQGLN